MVLFDIGSAACNMNSWKQELYENTHIGNQKTKSYFTIEYGRIIFSIL